jgi:hypothetical protein
MRKEALGVLTEEDRVHIKKAGLNIDRERVGNFAMGIDDVLSIMLQVCSWIIPPTLCLNDWSRMLQCWIQMIPTSCQTSGSWLR